MLLIFSWLLEFSSRSQHFCTLLLVWGSFFSKFIMVFLHLSMFTKYKARQCYILWKWAQWWTVTGYDGNSLSNGYTDMGKRQGSSYFGSFLTGKQFCRFRLCVWAILTQRCNGTLKTVISLGGKEEYTLVIISFNKKNYFLHFGYVCW